MNALSTSFGFTISNGHRSLSLREGPHFRMYPTGTNKRFGEELTRRQVDLLRIGMAVHVADGWVRRFRKSNGRRSPVVNVEVLDPAFWTQPDTYSLLKECVDFLSGDDDWSFRFALSGNGRHDHCPSLFRGQDQSALVVLYSGGLDSAAGLGARLAMVPGRLVIPVNLRHQMQKGQLVRDHFKLLVRERLVTNADLKPFQAGAFVKAKRIKVEFKKRLREETHRCRPIMIMSVAGMVADSVGAREVEILESGVGSVNLPLMSGPYDYRTTRSTHPHSLRLISDLVSHVNGASVHFILPFAHLTKAEVVRRAKELGLEELACKSISCILHPLRRPRGRQCGHCPACVYRRQAMISAGIDEGWEAYEVDIFAPRGLRPEIPKDQLRAIRAFQQQAGRLSELNSGRIPEFFRKFLYATRAVSTEEELGSHVEVYRRYGREWATLIADSRRRELAWIAPAHSMATTQGATA